MGFWKQYRITVILGGCTCGLFAIAGVAGKVLLDNHVRNHAQTEANEKARLLLEHNLAIHTYFSHTLKPHLFELTEPYVPQDYFDPAWMSSTYAVGEIDKHFQELDDSHYYYKECAINARSPENEADEYEAAFIRELNERPELESRAAERRIGTETYYTLLQRGEVMELACIRCHDTPERAPADLVKLYGGERSFGRTEGEVVSAVSLRIPVTEAYADSRRDALLLSVQFGVLLLVLLLATYVLARSLLVAPLRRVRNQALLIASGPGHLGETIPEPVGGELRALVKSFNRMSTALKEEQDALESKVAERTQALENLNRELEDEIEERTRMAERLRLSQFCLEKANDAIYWIAPDSRFIYVNEAACAMTGYSSEELLAMRVQDIAPSVTPERWIAHWQELKSSGETRIERVQRCKDGQTVEVEVNTKYLFFHGEEYECAFVRDISERKRSERALQESEERFRMLFHRAPVGYQSLDIEGNFIEVNDTWCEALGYTRDEVLGRNFGDFLAPEYLQKFLYNFPCFQEAGEIHGIEFEMLRKDGRHVFMAFDGRIGHHEDGSFKQTHCILQDITGRRAAEMALRASEEKFRALFEHAGDYCLVLELEDPGNPVIIDANEAALRHHGMTREEMIGLNVMDIAPGITLEQSKHIEKSLARYGKCIFETEHRRKDGTVFPVEASVSLICIGEKKPIAFSIERDITGRRHAEDEQRKHERKLSSMMRSAPMGIGMVSERVLVEANDWLCSMTGYSREELIGQSSRMLYPTQEEFDYVGREKYGQIAEKQTGEVETRWRRKDGEIIEILLRSTLLDTGDLSAGVTFTALDITERKRAVAERERLMLAIEQSDEVIVITGAEGNIQYVNPAFERVSGYTREEALGQNPRILKSGVHGEEFYASMWETLAQVEPWRGRMVNRRKDGTQYTEDVVISPVRDESGATVNYVAVKRDITAEIALGEQLRQAQKMEAVGQLAGGVAHDFNNLLYVIQGYSEMAMSRIEGDSPLRGDLDEVMKASQRAATLVKQLLAFSRRQVLEMTDLDLNEVMLSFAKMVRRVIGENIDLECLTGHGLGTVRGDRGQIEQILMNLCVNARDAMPKGGTLSIETENVLIDDTYCATHPGSKPGRYVLLSVTDSGVGMDEATREAVFEPFFTTKEVGQGTGLGLSTVYGLVKQHGGTVQVYSELGKGSTFKVYLPICGRAASEVGTKIAGLSPGGTETILLAEDEANVRDLTKIFLERAGYRVYEAANGEEALQLFEEHAEEIDLALLDVMMPKLDGRDAYEGMRQDRPGLRALFSSGYNISAIHTGFILDEGLQLIQKPYQRDTLLRRVREILDGK